ncbi:MAG: hypothetical protein LBQ46_13065 [Treponema sp.]|jgi:hypothetical protein|nr:hypothetical protein [Treponema sp.]
MCWILAYHESTIIPQRPLRYSDKEYNDRSIWDGSQNYKINNFESIKKCIDDFFGRGNISIDEISVNNMVFYTIKYGSCSCDFFTQSSINEFRDNFEYFIAYRMLIQSIEPYILIKWIDDKEILSNTSNEKVDIKSCDIRKVLQSKNPSGFYCVKREKQDEKYNNFLTERTS